MICCSQSDCVSKGMKTYAPIALFVYNRPLHTRQTVEALLRNLEAIDSEFYIFSDAAKNESSRSAVSEVRTYVNTISGFKKITIIEREFNWGLANSIIDGVSQLCDQYGRVIVLEDDLLVSPHFLSYVNTALEKYQNDLAVMQIAGYMFPMGLSLNEDALFLPFISSWGWATWSRAWSKFDPNAQGFQMLKKDRHLRNRFDLCGNYNYFKMLKSQQSGKTNSWAIRWYLSVFLNHGLTLYPRQTMVENVGFDGTGENCIVSVIDESKLNSTFKVSIFPTETALYESIDTVLIQMPRPKYKLSSIFRRFKRIMSLNA